MEINQLQNSKDAEVVAKRVSLKLEYLRAIINDENSVSNATRTMLSIEDDLGITQDKTHKSDCATHNEPAYPTHDEVGTPLKPTQNPSHDEVGNAAVPLAYVLRRYFDPHAYAVVTQNRVEICEGTMATEVHRL